MKLINKEPRNTPANARPESQRYVTPEVNIHETQDAYVLEADMPGVSKDGLEVLLESNELTLIGHRQAAAPVEGILFRESDPCDYRRAFELAPTIDATRITAKMDQGVLTLHLPKAEKVKPRKIEVSA
jgi:HSP20 family protein